MTENLWEKLCLKIDSDEDAPEWLREYSKLDFASIGQLKAWDYSSPPGAMVQPSLHFVEIKMDYLDFLKDQIRANARGQEWLSLLEKRLSILTQYVNQRLLHGSFGWIVDCDSHEGASVYFDPSAEKIVLLETT